MQELPAGTQIGGYRVQSLIGRGGMGVVYLAEHAGLERRVALKVLAPQFTTDAGFRARFERESRLAASLDHPNVIPIYEAGEADGMLFIAMRYVAGPDLRAVLDRDGRFDVSRTLAICAQLAGALDAAHTHGLIHRDVKPGNVLIAAGHGADGGEHVYLTDFGLTKHSASKSGLTQLGQMVGTIDYIAPEQILGEQVDGRADVYALGCVFFELLAGQPPYSRDSDLATMAAHLHEPPPTISNLRPDLPAAADELFATALAKKPAERFATASALVAASRLALSSGSTGGSVGAATILVTPSAEQRSDNTSSPAATPPPSTLPPTLLVTGAASAGVAAETATPPPSAPPGATVASPPPAGTGQIGSSAAQGNYPPGPPMGYYPPPSPPGRSNSSRTMAAVVGGLVITLLLLAGLAYFLGQSGASASPTPTRIADLSPTSAASAIGSPSLQPSTPPSTDRPTDIPSDTPTEVPSDTPTDTPTEEPTPDPTDPPTPTPASAAFESLMALLDVPAGAQCDEADVAGFLNPPPIVGAACTLQGDVALARNFYTFENLDDLNAAYTDLQAGLQDAGLCPTDLPSESGWRYPDDPPEVTRGRYSCWRNANESAQLSFTVNELLVYADLVGAGGTIGDLHASWFEADEDWINRDLIAQ